MKIQFVKSIFDIPYDEWTDPKLNQTHRGKAERITGNNGERSIMLILPCGHLAQLFAWKITDIDTDTPSATPSIFCKGGPNHSDCWHGYLTKGELVQ